MKLIVFETQLAGTMTEDAIAFEIASTLEGPAISCKVEKRDGLRVLVTVFPGPDLIVAAAQAGRHPRELFAAEIAAALNPDAVDQDLGALSREFESNGDPGAFGFDRTGGPSYGLYQLASRVGSVASFLKFIEFAGPRFFEALERAGGDAGARAPTAKFKAAWSKAAEDPDFAALQHAFIKSTYYDVFVDHVVNETGLDVRARHRAVQDVAWSTAVQHGQRNPIFRLALQGFQPSLVDDASLINAVYDERSRVDVHFQSSTPKIKKAVKSRFDNERVKALAMLA
ncbi:MAG: hypothetical protein ACFCUS_03620 [Rubrimonas sp.]